MSAVTFAKEQRDHVREVLTDIAGGRYWHTTEAFKLGRTHDITEMGQYLAERVEWSIVTVEATITARGGLPEARQTCLAAAAREVTRGAGPDAVLLLVADRNRDDALNRADQRAVAALRSTSTRTWRSTTGAWAPNRCSGPPTSSPGRPTAPSRSTTDGGSSPSGTCSPC